jgi:hypothetical protein
MRRTHAAALWLWAALAAPAASALSLAPGQRLEVPFSLTGAVAGADTLTFHLVNAVGVGVSTMTVELYDGATLLGSATGVPLTGVAGFVEVGSLWTLNAAVAVLSSVRDGTIDGLVRVLPDWGPSGALSAEVSAITSFAVGRASGEAAIVASGGVSLGTPSVVPEPRAALLCAALLALAARRR